MISIFYIRRRLLFLATAIVFSGHASAISLGTAAGQVVLGQPLNIAISLPGSAGQKVAASCFSLRAPAVTTDIDYVLRDGSLRLEHGSGQARLIVTGQRNWLHPVVEFRIVAHCDGAEVARDYVLLAGMPAGPGVIKTPQQATSVATAGTLSLSSATTLNALARERYPADRAARDEFRRLMAAANPELFPGKGPVGAVVIPAGTVLRLPPALPGQDAPLPVQRPLGETAKVAAKKPGRVEGRAKATQPAGDRLKIGGNTQVSSTKELERLDKLLTEQILLQESVSEKLKNLETTFAVMAEKLLSAEEQIRQAESARIRSEEQKLQALDKLAAARAKFGFFEILLLILTSGAIGAGLIFFHDRLRTRRQSLVADAQAEELMAPVVSLSPHAPVAELTLPKVEAGLPPQIDFVLDDVCAEPVMHAPDAVPPPPTLAAIPDQAERSEHDMVLELADVMASMGLTQGAAQALVEHIRANPVESVQHWMKLLDLYYQADLEEHLAASMAELKGKFNVASGEWSGQSTSDATSLMDFQHIAQNLVLLWKNGTCDAYLVDLLVDTRGGLRQGFPRAVVQEIILLRSILGAVGLAS